LLNLELFVSGKVRYYVGNAVTGGVGLNLTNANVMIYYSNDFSYRNRVQSEARQHRIGQTKSVLIYDIMAEHTIDERIVGALKSKKDLAVEMAKL
jgi:SNF2 family DNA or RNA helicase